MNIGFTQLRHDCCVYFKYVFDDSFIFLLLYINIILIAAKRMKYMNDLKLLLNKEFDMKELGATKKILGMEIYMDRKVKKLWVSQKKYIEKVLQRLSMEKVKLVSTLLS